MSNADDYRQHVENALREYIGSIRTEAMTIGRLADYFSVNRNLMAPILKGLDGVERIGRKYRVPLRHMPPAYHVAKGIIPRHAR